jgi:Tol biopolymer transport system component
MRRIIYLILALMNFSCHVLAEKNESPTGTISYIRLDTIQKIDLSTKRTVELLCCTEERPNIRTFRYAPDGHRFVVVMSSIDKEQANAELFIGDENTGQLKQLTKNNIFENYPAWSPDGKQIIFRRGIRNDSSRFWIINLESMQELQIYEPDFHIDRWADWLPDGQRLIVVAKTKTGASDHIELTGFAETNIVKGDARWLYKGDILILNPRFSPDRTRIACIVQSRKPYYNNRGEPEHINRVQILDLNTGTMSVIEDGPGTLERDLWPIWSPDGKKLAWIRTHGLKRTSSLLISNLKDRKPRKISVPEEAADGCTLLWSPDGKYMVVLTHQQRKNYTLRVIILESGKSREVLTSESQIQLLNWH